MFADRESLQIDLDNISRMWTKLATENKNIETIMLNTIWGMADLSVLWTTIARLKELFLGTPYPLHQDIIDGWKLRLNAPAVGWMISKYVTVPSDMTGLAGLSYGPRAGSLLCSVKGVDRSCVRFRQSFLCNLGGKFPQMEVTQEVLESLRVVHRWH